MSHHHIILTFDSYAAETRADTRRTKAILRTTE
ncbi:hypothetical protein CAJAP_10927 [Camponotus japonicus]